MSLLMFLIVVVVVPLAVGTVAYVFWGKRDASPTQIPALMFHDVLKQGRLDCSYVTQKVFADFIRQFVAAGNSTISLSEWFDTSAAGIQPANKTAVLTFDDGTESFYTTAMPLLDRYQLKATIFPIVNLIDKKSRVDVFSPQRHLSRDQLREIADRGHEIGSHTLSHPDLTRLSDGELCRELSESKALLAEIIGRPVTSIAFPYGSWNDRVWKIARDVGYSAASAYRGRIDTQSGILRVYGTYSFDSAADILDRLDLSKRGHFSLATGFIMRQFSRGSALWIFRPGYYVLPR